jgi:hypothetical protein
MKFKSDQYKTVRGRSRLLRLTCHECKSLICHYQKDGTGSLRRLYIDRICNPYFDLKDKILQCPNAHLLGTKTIYEKEKRPAFRLYVDAVDKKIISATKYNYDVNPDV